MHYVILTSKPGQFRTEPVEGIRPIEAYDYLFGATPKARNIGYQLADRFAASGSFIFHCQSFAYNLFECN